MLRPICSTYLSKPMKINSLFTGQKRIRKSHINYCFCWTLTLESLFFFFFFLSGKFSIYKLEILALEVPESSSNANSFASSALATISFTSAVAL